MLKKYTYFSCGQLLTTGENHVLTDETGGDETGTEGETDG